jgi:hypothetical protein
VTFSGSPSIRTIYTSASTQETFTGLPIIHVGSLVLPPNQVYQITATSAEAKNAGFARSISFNSSTDRGFSISVPSVGEYELRYVLPGQYARNCPLTQEESAIFAILGERDTFFELAEFGNESDCRQPTEPHATRHFTIALSFLPKYRLVKLSSMLYFMGFLL